MSKAIKESNFKGIMNAIRDHGKTSQSQQPNRARTPAAKLKHAKSYQIYFDRRHYSRRRTDRKPIPVDQGVNISHTELHAMITDLQAIKTDLTPGLAPVKPPQAKHRTLKISQIPSVAAKSLKNFFLSHKSLISVLFLAISLIVPAHPSNLKPSVAPHF